MNSIDQTTSTDASSKERLDRTKFGDRCQEFRTLHAEGCFIIPNPWDVGSAGYLQHLGFPALATTSAGFAFSQGLPDSDTGWPISRRLLRQLSCRSMPTSPQGMEPLRERWRTALRDAWRPAWPDCRIEDATGDPSAPVYDLSIALERLKSARQAIG